MKNKTIFSSLFICLILLGCKDNKNEPKLVLDQTPISVDCYQAIYEKDTLDMKINNLKAGKVTGTLQMALAGSTKIGKVDGAFRGDTLFVNYTFTDSAVKNKNFKNPMAFLKKDNQLILGNGALESTMGATYFVNHKSIDFDQVRYKFNVVDCLEK